MKRRCGGGGIFDDGSGRCARLGRAASVQRRRAQRACGGDGRRKEAATNYFCVAALQALQQRLMRGPMLKGVPHRHEPSHAIASSNGHFILPLQIKWCR